MDCRIDLYRLLGLDPGDAHIIRNGGGILTHDALRSIVLSQHLLGTDEIVVVQHTDCGMYQFDDRAFRLALEQESGTAPPWDEDGFEDVRANLATTVEALRSNPLLQSQLIRGLLYDTGLDQLEKVA